LPRRRLGKAFACHSLDYIQMNSPFLSAAVWDAEVGKMIKAFGAPIEDADAAAIKDYLKQNYSNWRARPKRKLAPDAGLPLAELGVAMWRLCHPARPKRPLASANDQALRLLMGRDNIALPLLWRRSP
jgi:hypothetical protein